MFGTVVEVANELRYLRIRRLIPRFYKDYIFKKRKKECLDLIKEILTESLIDYDIIVDFLRFYENAKLIIHKYDPNFPFTMNIGKDLISLTYLSGFHKCRLRFTNYGMMDVTETRYIPDSKNDDILHVEGIQQTSISQDEMTIMQFDEYKNGYCKIRLIAQIINYTNLYMSLVYEHGVNDNATNIHENRE